MSARRKFGKSGWRRSRRVNWVCEFCGRYSAVDRYQERKRCQHCGEDLLGRLEEWEFGVLRNEGGKNSE